jgi:predicted TIM-barrel fold metal-dependent hydrolase
METVPYQRVHLLSMPDPETTNHNAVAQAFKARHPDRVVTSGALDYTGLLRDGPERANDLAAQIFGLKAAGFYGLKLIEGKPQVRKLLPFPLDGHVYAEMWATLEALGFPVVLHVADPEVFWDPLQCPGWARRSGWCYGDGDYPPRESFYAEVDRILERHPNLKLTMAHFYFLSQDLERAAQFLDAHPSVCFDLTPHVDMYRDFSRDPIRARDFFLRYQDRIIYGTDLDTRVLQRGAEGMRFVLSLAWLIRALLEKEGAFAAPPDIEDDTYHGLGLPYAVLNRIYRTNFERVYRLR